MKRIINVKLRKGFDRSYRVVIEQGLMDRLPSIVARSWQGRRIFIISDSTVQRLYGRRLLKRFFDAKVDALALSVDAGEESKDARVVQSLYTNLLRLGIRRESLIVALGGGVVGDVAGYVAATILRSVPYVHVPTTLLAQVDSSVGGKVGINHPFGKNLIGAFYQPAAVFIDPDVLRTLTVPQFRNGLAEIVKIAAACDARFFRFLARNAKAVSRSDARLLSRIIARSVELKAAIVERDEKEGRLRKTLNVGHTIGHAIETATEYSLSHGEAVSVGIAAESALAVEMGLLGQKEYEGVTGLLRTFGLPVRFPPIRNHARFLSALSADKKAENGSTKFVLLNGIGSVKIGVNVPGVFIQQLLSDHSPDRRA